MPLVYRCKNCGFVFHYLQYVGQDYIGVPSVYEVMGKYGYTCPKCKSRLTPPSQQDILITSTRLARSLDLLPIKVGESYYVVRDSSIPALKLRIPVVEGSP
uniref:Uncharacterized protein n=1 Tax=Fervidicoccus fontis TaxID=683846 RepID=A0A7J3ZJB9_9CREN